MILSRYDEFRSYGFEEGIKNLRGIIAVKVMEKPPPGMFELKLGFRSGSGYSPESHSHSHSLCVRLGSGIISIGGSERPYVRGDWFDIAGNVPHGFVRVDELTIVVQSRAAREKEIRRP